ncbi:MAG: DUF3520 domain-containing protein [bacterium]|nr:DUF3520 domain-containing protein [bacterium]
MKKLIFSDLLLIKKPKHLWKYFVFSIFFHCIMVYGLMMIPFAPVKVNFTRTADVSSPNTGGLRVDNGWERGDTSSGSSLEDETAQPPGEIEPKPIEDANAPIPQYAVDTDTPIDLTDTGNINRARGARSTRGTRRAVNRRSGVEGDGKAPAPGSGQAPDLNTPNRGVAAPAYSYSYRPTRGTVDVVDTDEFVKLYRKPFRFVNEKPRSAFSLKVGTLSYPRVRRAIKKRELPEAEEIKIEEMVNYFQYDYPQPTGKDPISITTELASCPWNPSNRLLHIGLQGKILFKDGFKNSKYIIAKDVNIQVIFNPEKVTAYRLVGYSSRTPKVGRWSSAVRGTGDMRAGQKITSLYEIIPAVSAPEASGVVAGGVDTATVMVSYKEPKEEGAIGSSIVHWVSQPVSQLESDDQEPSVNFRFSAAVAQFGMMLENSENAGISSIPQLMEAAKDAMGEDRFGYRAEFIKLLETYRTMQEKKGSNR